MNSNSYAKQLKNYNRSKVNVENPGSIILLSYETLISSLRKSLYHIDKKNIEGANNALIKAQLIVSELDNGLNKEVAKDLCENLSSLYGYVYNRLIDANLAKSKEPIEECIKLIENIYEGWKGIIKGNKPMTVPTYGSGSKNINMNI